MSAIAACINAEIETAYQVNITLQFGESLKRLINILLDVKNRETELGETMVGASNAEICQACNEQIRTPARLVKEALRSRHPDADKLSGDARRIFDLLLPIWRSYDSACMSGYMKDKPDMFAQDNIHFCKMLKDQGAKSM
ncbi:hypothetical protein FB645_005450 [Coemansia sp. IMI 203386]|nr:hypothetical protein FB645_005450 [Coemansia sp. IMI 203386]